LFENGNWRQTIEFDVFENDILVLNSNKYEKINQLLIENQLKVRADLVYSG
jgi:hypothetical protein